MAQPPPWRLLATSLALGTALVCPLACTKAIEVTGGIARGVRTVTQGPPVEPAQTALGSDRSELPDRYPEASWLPIKQPLLSLSLIVDVQIGGVTASATLDTGAYPVFLSKPMARSLGINDQQIQEGARSQVQDAHGAISDAWTLVVDEVAVGAHRWSQVPITIAGEMPDLFLVGLQLLEDVDLYVAGDEGLVGIFELGAAPPGGDEVIPLVRKGSEVFVEVAARGGDGPLVEAMMEVDTGAWNTVFPVVTGIKGGLLSDLRFAVDAHGALSTAHERGRFVLDPLLVGPYRVPVGRVYALGATHLGGEGKGLLGNDVFMRHHTIFRLKALELALLPLPRRPSFRTLGPGGVACSDEDGAPGPCLRVSVGKPSRAVDEWARQDLCIQLDVEDVWAGKTIEMTITATTGDGKSAFSGGALRQYISVGATGFHNCQWVHRGTAASGLDSASVLSLQRVRVEGFSWPCDPAWTSCTMSSGPVSIIQ